MEYRSDLEAARMRVETLEAKLAEREASLRAREAEIAEKNAELARQRSGPRPIETGKAPGVIIALVAVVIAAMAGIVALLVVARAPAPPPPPPVIPPEPVKEVGPLAEGKTPQVKPDPRPAQAEGAAEGDEPPTLGEQVEAYHVKMVGKSTACLKEERKKNPKAGGHINVVFDVEPTGRVGRVELSSMVYEKQGWWSKEFEDCVVAAYKDLTFRPFEGTKTGASHNLFFAKPSDDLGF